MKLEIYTIGNREKNFLRKRQGVMKKSRADLVMLLNNDIKVSNFKQSIKLFNKDPKLFAVTFSPQSSETKKIKYVQDACGGSSIYRRKIWNKLGGIDFIFEPYWFDDTDYSKRAHDAGYFILEDGRIKVTQVSQMGAELIKKELNGKLIYFRNQFLFYKKHHIPMGKLRLLIPFYWPFIIWANWRYKKFYGS